MQAQVNHSNGLSSEQRHVFMDVISDSLRVSHRQHLFTWLQGELQYLLGHEVMLCGVKTPHSDDYHYEYFTSTRYFNEVQFSEVIEQKSGLVSQVVNLWKDTRTPLYVNNHHKSSNHANYAIANFDEAVLKNSELKNFVAHGYVDSNDEISSVVIFARLHNQPSSTDAHILELIMPHLHSALIRVTSSASNVAAKSNNCVASAMTKRESEILQWIHMGKSNWEISIILDISSLTVKNHLQKIFRKLDVQNRSQAAVKAAKLGLIKMLK